MAHTKLSRWTVGVVTIVALSGAGYGTDAPTSSHPAPTSEVPWTITQVAEPATPGAESPDATAEPSESPEPTQEPTQAPPTPEPETSEPEPVAPTATLTVTASPSESESAVADDGAVAPVGLWLGLGAVLAALAALIALFVMGSRRRKWEQRLEVERGQAAWVTDELAPALTDPNTPAAQVSQYWAAAQPTLNELDVNLARLVDDAPDEGRAMTARSIATALTHLRSAAAGHVALIGSGTAEQPTLGRSAAEVTTARNQLAAAVNPVER